MSADSLAKLLDSLAKLIGVMIWPAIFVFILSKFGNIIGEIISSISAITLKFSGFEASATRQRSEAIAALTTATATNMQEKPTPETAHSATKEAVRVVAEITPKQIRKVDGSIALWVDDRPNNNVYERQALEALGVSFVISTSTDDAVQKLRSESFDVIISDMGRPPDAQAGYTLLERLRASGNRTPYIIYAGSRSAEHQAEAKSRGAVGCTNRATELFEMVLSVLSL